MQIPGYEDAVLIAHGGSATVFRARQVAFERDVAVKVLTVELDGVRDRSRFEREVAAMGRLTGHPHIVTILDSGFTPDGRPYLTTPYYPQGSLGQQLARLGPFAVREVLGIGVAMAGALDAAHRRGILHRDVKPENILLSRYGESALTDFGIATDVGPGLSSTTNTTQAFTLGHAPPEVLEGGRATEASDIYSLASSLWMLLTGRTPFGGPPDEGLIPRVMRVKTEPVPPIGRADVPPSLENCLVAAMAKAPEQRILPAAAFGRALQDIQRELGLPVSELRTESVVDVRTEAIDLRASAPGPPVDLTSGPSGSPVPRWQGGNTRAASPTPVDLWADPAWRDEGSNRRGAPVVATPGAAYPLASTQALPLTPAIAADVSPSAFAPGTIEPGEPREPLEVLAPLSTSAGTDHAVTPGSVRPGEPRTPGRPRHDPSRRQAPTTTPAGRRRSMLAVVVVLLVAVVGLGLGFAAMRNRSVVTTTDAGPTTLPTTTATTTPSPPATVSGPEVTDGPSAPEPTVSSGPAPTKAPATTTSAPSSTTSSAKPPALPPGELIAPADLPAPAGKAAGVAQQAATALAVGDWDKARALVPSLKGSDNLELAKGWAGLNFATLVVTDWKSAKKGAVMLRLGEVAHESVGSAKRTSLYCVTWTVDDGHIVSMTDQQVIDPHPWRTGEWADPAEAVDVLRATCTKL